MLSIQLNSGSLNLFSMSLKRDIQATHTHKGKLCVLKSPREGVCIPLTSLLTDSWQLSVLEEANADWTEPHQNGRTSSLCAEISSWDVSNRQKYTHREEWNQVFSSKALGSPEWGGWVLMDTRGRLKIPLGPIRIQREASIACCPQPKIYSCQCWVDGRDGLNWESLLWWKWGDERQAITAGGVKRGSKWLGENSQGNPSELWMMTASAPHVGHRLLWRARALHYGGVQLTHVLINAQESVQTH